MKAALFLHSTGTSPLMWAGVPADALGDRVALAPAHLGYPPNERVSRGAPCDVFADAAHVLASIPARYDAIDLVAHSYGGFVAAKMLPALGARVRSLFLYEPVLFGALSKGLGAHPEAAREVEAFAQNEWFLYDDARGGTEPWLELFIDYWNRPGSWSRLPEPARDAMRSVGWKMFQEVRSCFLAPQRFDELAVRASVPFTLAVGARSPAASRAMARAVTALNPHARVVEFDKLGHMGPLTGPGLVHDALRVHFHTIDARARGGLGPHA